MADRDTFEVTVALADATLARFLSYLRGKGLKLSHLLFRFEIKEFFVSV